MGYGLLVSVLFLAQLAWGGGLGVSGHHYPMRFEENLGQWPESVLFVGRSSETGLMYFTKQGVSFSTGLWVGFDKSNPTPNVYASNPTGGESAYYVGDSTRWAEGVRHYQNIVYKDIYPGIDVVFYPSDRALEYDFIVSPGSDPAQVKLFLRGHKSLRLKSDGVVVARSKYGEMLFRMPISYQIADDGSWMPIESKYRILKSGRLAFEVGVYDESKELVIDPVATMGGSWFLEGSAREQPLAVAVDLLANPTVIAVGGFTQSNNATTGFFTSAGATGSNYANTSWQASNSTNGFVSVTTVKLTGGSQSSVNWSVFIGGVSSTSGTSATVVNNIKIDSSGNIYIVGRTNSGSFPGAANVGTANATPTSAANGTDGFVMKLTLNASNKYQITYSTLISAGSGFDTCNSLVLDTVSAGCTTGGSACVAVVGTTTQNDPKGNAFYAHLNSSGTIDVTLREFGGTDRELGEAIILDNSTTGCTGTTPCPVIAGDTRSTDAWLIGSGATVMSTTPAASTGKQSVFIAHLNSSGQLATTNATSGIPWVGIVSGSGAGSIQVLGGLALGNAGILVSGTTNAALNVSGTSFSGSQPGGLDIFIAKVSLTSNSSSLIQFASSSGFGNYLGGTGNDFQYNFHSLVTDQATPPENIYVTGMSSAGGFISATNVQASPPTGFGTCVAGGSNAFVSKFALGNAGPTIDYTTCLGSASGTTTSLAIPISNFGSSNVRDLATAIAYFTAGTAPNNSTNVIIVGQTQSYVSSTTSGGSGGVQTVTGGFPYNSTMKASATYGTGVAQSIDGFMTKICQLNGTATCN